MLPTIAVDLPFLAREVNDAHAQTQCTPPVSLSITHIRPGGR